MSTAAGFSPVSAALPAWRNPAAWAKAAGERVNVTREVEQEPNAALAHLSMLTGATSCALLLTLLVTLLAIAFTLICDVPRGPRL